MNKKSIDSTSPVPLFHQIAEAIREQIENGELLPGDALEPLREAASTWGVNLHTVRHAYTALSREGLLKSQGAKGTRVTSKAVKTTPVTTETSAQFVGRFIRQANRKFGIDATTLAGEVASYSVSSQDKVPVIFVVECSAWQCEAHASEIEARFRVEARGWSLEQEDEPPAGIIIATYFHYNDIRCRWPHRLH
jgi:DNA-binding transcriptional regulator YhcF (GntR family)